MKKHSSKLAHNSIQSIIFIPLGSTPILVVQDFRTREIMSGLGAEDWVKVVGFDAQDVEHHAVLATVNKNLQSIKLMSSEIVRGVIGDKETRYKAEQQGRLWMVSRDFCEDPGVADENVGVGGDPRLGRALFALNQNTFSSQFVSRLRKSQDYQQQQVTGNKKNANIRMQPIIQVFVIFSALGGTGHGVFGAGFQTIADKAAELKMNIRITPIVLLMGTLNPGDRHAGACNQLLALRSSQVQLEGKFKDLNSSNGDFQVVTDPPLLVSNCNDHGEMANLTRVNAVLSQFLYLICRTSFGPQFRQEAINLHENKTKDETGDLRRAATFGLSAANLNNEKISAYAADKTAYLFLSTLLDEREYYRAVKHALVITSSLSLRETHTEDMAAQRLFSLQNKGNINVQERARSVFRQLAGNRTGFKGCSDLYRAARHTLEREIPSFLAPAMNEEAANWLNEGDEVLRNEISQYLEKQTGLVEGQRFLEHMKNQVDGSEKFNNDKLAQAQSSNKDIHKGKASCEKIYHKLEKSNWLFRFFRFFAKAKFRRQYPRYVDALIRNELEITARKILSKKVFRRIHEIIRAELEHLSSITNTVISICDYLHHEVNRLKNLSDEFYTPVGCGLDNAEFMDHTLERIFNNEGGKSKAIRRVFEALCGEYGSIDAFGQQNPQEIQNFLIQHCRQMAHHTVEKLDVLDVFKAAFPNEQQQYEAIGQLIAQSDGRVKISGEGDEDIARIKYVCGPDACSVEWAVNIANEVSRRGGDWRGHVDESLSGIFFLQYRTQVSLTQQIADTSKLCKLPDDPKKLVQMGDDPVIQLAPLANCSAEVLDLVIAQGLVSKQICRNSQGYELKGFHEPITLGNSLEQIRTSLGGSYRNRMRIYRQFCMELAKNPQNLLKSIEEAIANNPANTDSLASQLGQKPFRTTREVAEALLPYVRRIRLTG